MLELLFLLLPVAVAYGWIMGKHKAKQELLQQQSSINQALTSSVTLLLNNKEEQAFDKLIQYFDDTHGSIENYLTLAKLFRKKGEIDKAIAIHQGLVNTDQINIPQFDLEIITLELAQDFMSAGMLEHAEKELKPLLQTQHANDALLMLLHLYEQTREWQKGIDVYLQTKSSELTDLSRQLVSHYYCELADQSDNVKTKKKLFKRALDVYANCVRSLVSLAKIYRILGNKQKSRELIVQILENEPTFAPALFDIASECFVDEFEQAAWLYWLLNEKKIKSVNAHNEMANFIAKEKGIEPARQYIINQLQSVPSVRGFGKLIELEKEFFVSSQHYDELLKLINHYIELKPNYECRSCGFSTNNFNWRCPACNSWQTIKPLTGLDGI